MSNLKSFHCSFTLIVQFQPASNCLKSTVNTRRRCEICSKSTIKHQNQVIDIVVVSLSITLSIFHQFFLLFLLLTLNKSLLAGNDSSNCYIFMLIIVTHSTALMSLQAHIIHRKKFKNSSQNVFRNQYMEQDSKKNCLALVKNNRVSKYMLFMQNLCCS